MKHDGEGTFSSDSSIPKLMDVGVGRTGGRRRRIARDRAYSTINITTPAIVRRCSVDA
jgi:hypothetical protein